MTIQTLGSNIFLSHFGNNASVAFSRGGTNTSVNNETSGLFQIVYTVGCRNCATIYRSDICTNSLGACCWRKMKDQLFVLVDLLGLMSYYILVEAVIHISDWFIAS